MCGNFSAARLIPPKICYLLLRVVDLRADLRPPTRRGVPERFEGLRLAPVLFLAAFFFEAVLFFGAAFFFAALFFFGTLAPSLRASDSPIAIACFRLVTLRPLLLLRVPRFFSRMTSSTFSPARLEYFAISKFFKRLTNRRPLTHPSRYAGHPQAWIGASRAALKRSRGSQV